MVWNIDWKGIEPDLEGIIKIKGVKEVPRSEELGRKGRKEWEKRMGD